MNVYGPRVHSHSSEADGVHGKMTGVALRFRGSHLFRSASLAIQSGQGV